MLRRLGVRGKILATLAVPVLVLVLGAGYLVAAAYDTWQYSRLQSSYLGAAVVQDELIEALQEERWTSVSVATGRAVSAAELDEARKATDDALSKRERALRQMDLSDSVVVNKTMAEAARASEPAAIALTRSLVDQRVSWGTTGGGQNKTTANKLDVRDVDSRVVLTTNNVTNLDIYDFFVTRRRRHKCIRCETWGK